MFLNLDNISKKGVIFEKGDSFFRDRNGTIHFKEIEWFYVSSVNHYTNSVYEGHEYTLRLGLKGSRKYYVLEACSNRKEPYETICNIHDEIASHMSRRLQDAYSCGLEVLFPTYRNRHSISIADGRILAKASDDEGDPFEVDKIVWSRDGRFLHLKGAGRKISVPIENISNVRVFLVMAGAMISFESEKESVSKKYLSRAFYFLVGTAGLNKWIGIYQGPEWFDTVCIFSGILLGVWGFTAPLFYLVHRLNMRKLRKVENARLSRQ